MQLNYSIPEYAEVISSIGVALAMIRDVVERIIPNPTKQDIAQLKREAANLAIKNGAVPDTIEVHIEVDSQTSKVTAIALGSNEVQATDLLNRCDQEEAKVLAAASMHATPADVRTIFMNDTFFVIGRMIDEKQQLRVIDCRGFIKVQCSDAVVTSCKASDWKEEVAKLWNQMLGYKYEMVQTPDIYLCIYGKVMDFSNVMDLDQLITLMDSEFSDADPNESVIMISARQEVL